MENLDFLEQEELTYGFALPDTFGVSDGRSNMLLTPSTMKLQGGLPQIPNSVGRITPYVQGRGDIEIRNLGHADHGIPLITLAGLCMDLSAQSPSFPTSNHQKTATAAGNLTIEVKASDVLGRATAVATDIVTIPFIEIFFGGTHDDVVLNSAHDVTIRFLTRNLKSRSISFVATPNGLNAKLFILGYETDGSYSNFCGFTFGNYPTSNTDAAQANLLSVTISNVSANERLEIELPGRDSIVNQTIINTAASYLSI